LYPGEKWSSHEKRARLTKYIPPGAESRV
jgi:hypothetical protein